MSAQSNVVTDVGPISPLGRRVSASRAVSFQQVRDSARSTARMQFSPAARRRCWWDGPRETALCSAKPQVGGLD